MDTRKPYSGTAELLPLLTVYSANRDRAIGLPRAGRRTLNLVGYRARKERQATAQLAGAAFLRGLIEECRAEVGKLIEGADTADKRREILPEVERLQDIAKRAASELDRMTPTGSGAHIHSEPEA